MNITKDTIDIHKLVDTIHAVETAQRSGTWATYAKENGQYSSFFYPTFYSTYATGLYTLRAWLRGKLHRQNPPEEIRDFNRTVQEQGLPYKLKKWDATEHNQKIAEEFAGFFREEAATG